MQATEVEPWDALSSWAESRMGAEPGYTRLRKSVLRGILRSCLQHCLSTVFTSTRMMHESKLGQTTFTLYTTEFPVFLSIMFPLRYRWLLDGPACLGWAAWLFWWPWVDQIFLAVEELQLHICRRLQGEINLSLIFRNRLTNIRFVEENAGQALLKFHHYFYNFVQF